MRRLLPTLIAVLALLLGTSRAASADAPFAACGAGWECATLTVPLARDGSLSDTVDLRVQRLPARSGHSHGTVLFLAGGPGQSAISMRSNPRSELAPLLDDHDLVVFDARGTGRSGRLTCGLPAACIAALGPRAGWYTSADTAEDIEAVRALLGVERLSIDAVSYGTHVAMVYALLHPDHVERLLLDSVEPLAGQDGFETRTFAAIPRVLRTLCAHGACRGVTRDPVGDVARLARRLRARQLLVRDVGPRGQTTPVSLDERALLQSLRQGDVDPGLLAAFPAAVTSALNGDATALGRLAWAGDATADDAQDPAYFSSSLFATTACSEYHLPYGPDAAPADRYRAILRAARTVRFWPFSAPVGAAEGFASSCIRWTMPRRPQPQGPLPDVPILLLSGQLDMRTPLANAHEVAAHAPRAHVLAVPDAGHAVLDRDPTGCATRAAVVFLRGADGAPRPCRSTPRSRLRIAPLVPAHVPVLRRAVDLTLADLRAYLGPPWAYRYGALGGGLRGGSYVADTHGVLRLRRLSAVRGVALTGRLDLRTGAGRLRVAGTRLTVRGWRVAR